MSLRVCSVPRCPRLYRSKDRRRHRCDPHQAEHEEQDAARRLAKRRTAGRNTAHWRRLCAVAMQRAAGHCEICGQPLVAGDDKLRPTVHLDPALEGQHQLATLDDVVVAHASCHGRVDAPRASKGGCLAHTLVGGSPAPGAPRVSPNLDVFQ